MATNKSKKVKSSKALSVKQVEQKYKLLTETEKEKFINSGGDAKEFLFSDQFRALDGKRKKAVTAKLRKESKKAAEVITEKAQEENRTLTDRERSDIEKSLGLKKGSVNFLVDRQIFYNVLSYGDDKFSKIVQDQVKFLAEQSVKKSESISFQQLVNYFDKKILPKYAEKFKQRTGKKILRGFKQSPEFFEFLEKREKAISDKKKEKESLKNLSVSFVADFPDGRERATTDFTTFLQYMEKFYNQCIELDEKADRSAIFVDVISFKFSENTSSIVLQLSPDQGLEQFLPL